MQIHVRSAYAAGEPETRRSAGLPKWHATGPAYHRDVHPDDNAPDADGIAPDNADEIRTLQQQTQQGRAQMLDAIADLRAAQLATTAEALEDIGRARDVFRRSMGDAFSVGPEDRREIDVEGLVDQSTSSLTHAATAATDSIADAQLAAQRAIENAAADVARLLGSASPAE